MPTQRVPRQAGLALAAPVRYRRLPVADVSTGGGPPTPCQPTVTWIDTFGMDDALKIIYGLPFPDSFGMTEDALGVKVGLSDSFAVTDLLTVVLASTHGDSFALSDGALGVATTFFDTLGADDRLSLVKLVTTVVDTFGVTDAVSLATILSSYADTFGLDDDLSHVDLFATYPDTVGLADHFLGVRTGLVDTLGMDDLLVATLAASFLDTFGTTDDFTKAQIRNWQGGRSGTPDTDASGDTYVDQAAATTNFGAAVGLIVKGKSTLANDEQRGLLEFDFTRYTSMSAFVGGVHSITMEAFNGNALLSTPLSVQVSTLGARPFVESTVTWNSPVAGGPAAGTVVKTQAYTVPANSSFSVVMTFTDAELNAMLGNWVYVRLTSTGAAAPINSTVRSREYVVDVTKRPTWSFDLTR